MRAITLWQPWASLIAEGHKTIETRTHNRFRCLVGQRIAIHAAKRFDGIGCDVIRRNAAFGGKELPEELLLLLKNRDESAWPYGVVLCTVLVGGARWFTPSADSIEAGIEQRLSAEALSPVSGQFGLLLYDVKLIVPPVRARGHQGIWEWNEGAE